MGLKAKQAREMKRERKERERRGLVMVPTPGLVSSQLQTWIRSQPSFEEMGMMHNVLGYFFGALTQTLTGAGVAAPGLAGFERGASMAAAATGKSVVLPPGATQPPPREAAPGVEAPPLAQQMEVNIQLQPLTGEAIVEAANVGAARVEA